MSVELIRRAAALMRERAEGATEGPWRIYSDPGCDALVVLDQYGMGVQSSTTLDIIAYDGQIYSRDAAHIASWHPVVALAVADWLDAESASHVHLKDEEPTYTYDLPGMDASPAVRVARAYLGSDA